MTKSILRRTDFTLLAATLGIILMSLVIIGSATHINTPSDDRYWFVARQGIFALMNIGLAVFQQRGITPEELVAVLHLPYAVILSGIGTLEVDGFLSTDLLQRCSIASRFE